MPIREPGERAITEEELELSRSAKALLDAGLARGGLPRADRRHEPLHGEHRRLVRSVFGEALLQPGDTERDLGLRYAETLRNLGPLAAPTLEQMFNLRLRERMREAVISQAELQSGRLAGSQAVTVGFVDIVGLHQARRGRGAGGRGRVVRRFERAVADAVEPPVRLVKTIGDAAMLVAPGARAGRRRGPRPRRALAGARRRCCAAAWPPARGCRARATGTAGR